MAEVEKETIEYIPVVMEFAIMDLVRSMSSIKAGAMCRRIRTSDDRHGVIFLIGGLTEPSAGMLIKELRVMLDELPHWHHPVIVGQSEVPK
jgi:hypothetical protein